MQPADGITAPPAASPPRISRALLKGLSAAYDRLGTVLVGSLLWFGLAALLAVGGAGLVALTHRPDTLGGALLGPLAGLAVAFVGTGPFTAALFDHVRRILRHEEPYGSDLLKGVPALWRRGLALSTLQVLVTLVLVVDAFFFLGQKAVAWRMLGMLFIYPVFFWWGAALLQWPLAVECRQDSLWSIVKKSGLLLLDNIGYTFVLSVVLAGFTALGVVTRIGLVLLLFLWAGLGAFVLTAAFQELLPKYGLAKSPSEAREDDS